MSEILFEITKEHLETGMRGYPVGYCPTSYVDPQKGIFYRGKSITELAYKEPIEVIYLLYHGKEGKKEEIKKFAQDLARRSFCTPSVLEHVQKLPRSGHPMKLFAAALLVLGMFDTTGDYREDCLNLIAKIPHLVAVVINHHSGWGKTPEPRPDLGYMENFTYMLQVPQKRDKELERAFKLFNILHYDHGGGNLSTFVGKAVASGLEDMYGSMSSAMCALAGPRHGRANQDCLEFVQGVLDELGEDASDKEVEECIRRRVADQKLIFGFGHAVLRVQDTRASVQYDFVQKHYPGHPLVKIALKLAKQGEKVLSENPKITDPHPNVDAISGTLLTASGFPFPQYYAVLFGLSRCVGIPIQIVYERCEARKGKGTPIVRPRYLYLSER